MDLSEAAGASLRPDMTPRTAVTTLLNADLPADALKLLARLLPKRYAVAWACQCAKNEVLSHEDKAGASLAANWVRDPSEANRRAAFEFANAGGYKSCGTWLAATAGWSGGSLAPASQKVAVPPAEHLTARAAVAAVTLLAALDTQNFLSRRARFIEHALTLLGEEESLSDR